MEDREFDRCMKRMRQGEKDALKEIYEYYVNYIFFLIVGIVKQKETAEDITSEFFIKLYEKSDSYKPGKGHKAWISQIARNLTIDYLRSHKKEVDLEDDILLDDAIEENTPETIVIEETTISDALGMLKENERSIVHLKVLGDLTFQQIADTLKLPMGTVTTRYKTAIKKLRRCGYETGF